ncbi:MAG: ADP-glyceromanno-heptose 6-epimerase [Bacteroidia bacterium]|nr:ADP-glyceromanno-heptose 6-epimerase [Bacteroidia bacterium]
MIVITGAAGFIGSCLVSKLNKEGYNDLVLVDDFSHQNKKANYEGKLYTGLVERENLFEWLKSNANQVQFIYHIGARTDTAEFDYSVLEKLNVEYTRTLWNICIEEGIPFVYASSAATYGLGENGFEDNESLIHLLKPLNPYGDSKNEFDKWAIVQEKKPYFWVGLKFFNVYGPNEYHKGRMGSVMMHATKQIKETGKLKLFKSHRPDFENGGQKRDFIYVKDVVEVLYFWLHHRKGSGIYNLGSGTARTFNDLANSVFSALDKKPDIEYIDTPADIRDKYQYFTEASMEKIANQGYNKPFHTLEEGVSDYVKNYLNNKSYY